MPNQPTSVSKGDLVIPSLAHFGVEKVFDRKPDRRAKPCSLSEEDTAWVERTLAAMTLNERISQLFAYLFRTSENASGMPFWGNCSRAGLCSGPVRWQKCSACIP